MRYLLTENPYIWSRFTTGDSVTITIYKSLDDSVVVNAVSMSELAATGYFKYQFNPAPGSLTEYFYVTTNGTEEHAGKIILGGYPDGIKDKTDNLPASPAPANEYDTEIGYIPADLSDVPTAAELDAAHGSGSWTSTDVSGIQTDVTAIKAKTDTIDWTNITSLIDEIGGKWEIVGNQMIFYKSDNSTEIMRFNLFDAEGNPTMNNVYKRERV